MAGWKAKQMVLRAFFCALLPCVAIASSAQSPGPAPLGIPSPSIVADLGPGPAMGRQPVPPDPAIGGNPLWSVPLTALSATGERPIFSPSRRPPPPQVVAAPYAPPPEPPPAPPPEPDHPLLTLLGIIAGDTGGVGIFIDQNDNAPLSLKIGEGRQGWVLRAVRGREAVFEKNNRAATLALPSPEQPKLAAPADRTPTQAPKPNSDFWSR
jgi:hypothetical protein